jgi:hypothetical protein
VLLGPDISWLALLMVVDQAFVDMLLMTYKSLTTPAKLLGKIIQRFQIPATHDEKSGSLSMAVVCVCVCVCVCV